MADPEGSQPDKAWERYEEADSEEGPLGAITSIPKVAAEAFFAQTLKDLGEVVGHAVLEWMGTQIVNKAMDAVEIDRDPQDPPAASAPVDMGTPAMGVPADAAQGEDAASPRWDPSGAQDASSQDDDEDEEDDAATAPAAPSDPVDMGSPAMGVPEEPSTDTPDLHVDSGDSVTLPVGGDLNIGAPDWDPGANASGFAGPPEMPPIPLAPDSTE